MADQKRAADPAADNIRAIVDLERQAAREATFGERAGARIAQNRMSRQTDERDHLNLQIDLLAEREMTLMLKMLRRVADRLGVDGEDEDDARAEKLAAGTNVYELVRTLRKEENERR